MKKITCSDYHEINEREHSANELIFGLVLGLRKYFKYNPTEVATYEKIYDLILEWFEDDEKNNKYFYRLVPDRFFKDFTWEVFHIYTSVI